MTEGTWTLKTYVVAERGIRRQWSRVLAVALGDVEDITLWIRRKQCMKVVSIDGLDSRYEQRKHE